MKKTLYNRMNQKDSYNLWMAYPACEAFALASLGFMWLYKLAEENPLINTELVCTDTERARTNPSALAFSMSFDFDFMGVFELLEKYNIPYSINYGLNYFPEKNYKGITYEAGEYESLVISLGEASGNNWWCIMYPPLCLLEKNTSQNEKTEYKSYLWEIISQLTS